MDILVVYSARVRRISHAQFNGSNFYDLYMFKDEQMVLDNFQMVLLLLFAIRWLPFSPMLSILSHWMNMIQLFEFPAH